jgi:hypothetical protein
VESASTRTKAEGKSNLFEFVEAEERADERSEETSLTLCLVSHPHGGPISGEFLLGYDAR